MHFNINDTVKVQLTERGREILKRQYEEAVERCPALKQFLYEKYKEDAEGWSEWQLWDLMFRFGQHMNQSGDPPFKTVIRIEESK